MSKAAQGLGLIAAAIVLAAGAAIVRSQAIGDHDYDQTVNSLAGRMSTGQFGEVESFNNAPYIAAWVVAGLLFLAGVILYAGQRD